MTTSTCPICQASNPIGLFFCGQCGADLSIDRPSAPLRKSAAEPVASAKEQLVKCRKCASENDRGLFLCSNCGHELNPMSTLTLLVNEQCYPCADGDVLGRNGTVAKDYFSSVLTVSRQHVSVHYCDGRWVLRLCPGVANLTEVDGNAVQAGADHILTADHRLRLSKKCEVHLRVTEAKSV